MTRNKLRAPQDENNQFSFQENIFFRSPACADHIFMPKAASYRELILLVTSKSLMCEEIFSFTGDDT